MQIVNRISKAVQDGYQIANSSSGNALGDNSSPARKALSPFYINPDKTNIKNAELAKKARIAIFAVNGAGIIASHSIFFKSSTLITPKKQLSFSPDLKMTQKNIDDAYASMLKNIGGNKYQEYINYFEQYPNIANITITDPGLQTAIDSTISKGKTNFFEARFTTFKGRNDVTGDFEGSGGAAIDVSNLNNYNNYFIAKYPYPEPKPGDVSTKPTEDQKMDYAVSQHNASFPHNKIYRTVSDVTDEDASIEIKKLANEKTTSLLNTEFNLFNVFNHADKVGFGFLFAFQWLIAIASFTGIFTAKSAISKKRSALPVALPPLAQVARDPIPTAQAESQQPLPAPPDFVRMRREGPEVHSREQSFRQLDQAGFPPPLPALRGASRVGRRVDNRANHPPQDPSLMSSAHAGFLPPLIQQPSGDGNVYGGGLREQSSTDVSVLYTNDSPLPLPPPPGSPPEAQTVIRPDPIHTQSAEAVLVSSLTQFGHQGQAWSTDVSQADHRLDPLGRAGGEEGAARLHLRRRISEASPEQAGGFLVGGERLQSGAGSHEGYHGPVGEMQGGGAGVQLQRDWGTLSRAGQGEDWGRGEAGSDVRSEIRPAGYEEGVFHSQERAAATVSAAPPGGSPSRPTRRNFQRRAVTLAGAPGSEAPAPRSPGH
jgi:hypothetical protein